VTGLKNNPSPLVHYLTYFIKKKYTVPDTGPVFIYGQRDKNKFLSCLATRSFILGTNRSPLFCPPEKVNRASVQTTALSILKI